MKLAFNKEFLKFNPIMFLIKRFTFGNFFVASPLIGFCLGLLGGLFEQVGFLERSWFTLFLRSRTAFEDFLLSNLEGIVPDSWDKSLLLAYLIFSFIWYIKINLFLYLIWKLEFIFFPLGNKLSPETLYEKNAKSFGRNYDEKDVYKLVASALKTAELLKRY